VIAVVLSGNLDDGAAGLRAVADAGGAAIVQDPRGAVYPSMPESALAMVPEAEVVPLLDIAARIVALVGSPAPGVPPVLPTRRPSEPHRLDPVELGTAASQALSEEGAATGFTCPECHGAMFDVDAAGVPTYRCRVGHAFSDASLMAAQAGSLEAALWIALRALEEGAEVAARLAERAERRGARVAARAFLRDESRHRARARILRAAIDASDAAPEIGATDARGSG
jgi:two-component system chemotaxis response regulator CheB